MSAPDIIRQLVDKFQYNLQEYKNPRYSETQVRVEFINPFWEALGWDVLNKSGNAMAYRDVIHEAQIKVGSSTKAPDYAFKVGKERIFFLEAKKPSRDLKNDPEPAFQLRRYAYSAKLPLSVLTDFEEMSIYDTRIKPAITDKSHIGRMLYYHYDEYLEKWEEISETFSKEAVMRGAFDRFVEDKSQGRGTTTLDRDFLNSLDEWRISLAHNIALRNPDLSERELNYAVQMTIDRLIFLRMAEDRGIETYGTLQALQNGDNCYRRLVQVYYRADERYNSGLFHFEEKDGAHPDVITPDLEVDDKVLKEIIRNVYYPCPYEFSQLPVEVLGNAYEQFLGKRITLTSGHRARIEEKPEVRKAGGVYYTPQYIVDYIVEHTVGELVKDKTPKQVSELRILDPACGSGSFLLGAYQYLLDWHLKAYVESHQETGIIPSSPPAKGQRPRKSDPQAIFQDKNGQWSLSTAEKKRILLNNIYGVDIDANAVEVTKLSLLLKVLEDENSETLHQQLGLWHERALPNLSGNIKCGNSLIGPDYYENQQSALFDENEMLRVNAFDWQKEFADVFAQVGFDAVIGNPPYGAILTKNEIDYLRKYTSFSIRGESYVLFIEKAISIVKNDGKFGYIVPDTYLNLGFTKAIRDFILQNSAIKEIVALPANVFKSATVDTTLLLLSKKPKQEFWRSDCQVAIFQKKAEIDNLQNPKRQFSISTELWKNQGLFNILASSFEVELIDKIELDKIEFSNFVEMFSGVKAYEVGKGKPAQTTKIRDEKPFTSSYKKSDEWQPLFDGKHIGRYQLLWDHNNWIKYGPWLAAPRDDSNFKGEKILIRKIVGKTLIASYFPYTSYCNTLLFIVKANNRNINILPFLGILNSHLIGWYFRKKFLISDEDTFPQIMIRDILQFPFPKEIEDSENKFAVAVQQMLDLNKALLAARDPHTREQLERQVEATDKQIDKLVYDLYELTEDEINIVESTANK